ncbi:MAG: ABC transporter permease subunit [Pseudonocardiaceae bacterium]|nr:ABC transporter permease subunit [Pseudonocardiaceae bacterium]
MTTTETAVAAADTAPRDTRQPRRRRPWQLPAARLAVPLLALLAWQLIDPVTDLVPAPADTIRELYSGFVDGWIYEGLRATASAVGTGFVLGTVVAFPLGYLMGSSKTLTAIFEPLVAGTFAVPRVILYPILLAVFGVGLEAESAMVAISAFFPILMSTAAAVRNVSPSLLKLGRSLSARPLQIARKIVIPDAAPSIMVGIRIGFSIAFIAAIIAELFAAKDGLGLLISQSYAVLDLPRMYAVVLLVMLAAFAGNLLLWWAERRLRKA